MASNQGEPSDTMVHASAEPNPPNPGLLTFRKLTINKGQITRVEEKRMESTIQTQDGILQRNIYSEQFCNAARNVKGVMVYHSHKKSEAIKIWQETLASDETNLNALQDITLAYQKLCYNRKAQEYEAQLRNTIQDASPDEKQMMFARCQAEQGYALSQDLHTESWIGINLQVNCYEDALKMAEGLIKQKEKRDWLLYTGKAYETLCHASFRAGRQDIYLDSIGKAIEKLHEALQMPDENPLYQAEIWLTIGSTFARVKRCEEFVPPKLVEEFYKEGWEDPMKYYRKALEFGPDNLWLLGRMGIYLFKRQNYDGALKWLNQCIHDTDKLPPEDPQRNSSWNALSHRAKIYIKKAKRSGTSERYSLLKEAQLDANKALELAQFPTTLVLAGEVNHLLAKHPLTPPNEVDHLRNIALDRFYEGSVSQEGSTSSDVHLKRAECLQDGEDLQSAIESFKIAFDTITGTEAHFRALLASKLLNAMLGYYKGSQKCLFGEVAFWFIYIHKSCQAPHNYIKMLDVEYAPEILDILEYNNRYVSDQSTTPQEMIKTFKEVMNKRNIGDRSFKMRLSNLGEKRNPSLSQEQEPEPSAIQEDDDIPIDCPLTSGVDFDFYILHEGDDPDVRGWIRYSLLKGLECKLFALKGYYHQRDSRLGALPYQSKAKVMKNSAKILIVLSHGFDGSKDVTTEIAQSSQAENTENIIVLLREPVEVPIHLQGYKKFDFTVQEDLPQLVRYLLPVPSL